jgi:hypothetical protein
MPATCPAHLFFHLVTIDMSRRGAKRILERSKQTGPYSKHGDGAPLKRMVE